jgi:ribosome-associated translation inhibitor RaiA
MDMQEAIQITFRGMDPSEFIEQRILTKAADLERFCSEIVSCHVTVETQHHKHHKGNLCAVRIDLRVPGKEIVAGREHRQSHAHEDVYVAIRDAFDAAVRQLEDYARLRRGDVKRHDPEGKQGTPTSEMFRTDDVRK